jgi:hypothetical protein
MTTPLEEELLHLQNLMTDPYREHWSAYCWAKALCLAKSDPENYADLPERLKAAMKRGSPESSASGQ